MYIPKLFQMKDLGEIKQFIRNHPFGTIVSNDGEKPIATHVPLMLRNINEQLIITGHMAKANPQWKNFEQTSEKVLIMFQGPHTYVSASWYETERVSTWNYQSVHIYGHVQLMNPAELVDDLAVLLKTYEQDRENPVLWETLSDKTKQQMHGVVGFKVIVQDIQAAYKLSQNRNDRDFANIIKKLSEGDDQAKQIAEAMRNVGRNGY